MRGHQILVVSVAVAAATIAVSGGGPVRNADSLAASRNDPTRPVYVPGNRPHAREDVKRLIQPNTKSPDWKQLSKDVGLELTRDERFGLRGRLFVRIDGAWYPVLIDGPSDVAGIVPAG